MKSTGVNGICMMIGDGVFVGAEELVYAADWPRKGERMVI